MDNNYLKMKCLEFLYNFIKDSSNENKMELHLIYDEVTENEKIKILGRELNDAISKIIIENYHPDEYLEQLKKIFFES